MQLVERESDSTGVAKESLLKGWDEAVCFGCTLAHREGLLARRMSCSGNGLMRNWTVRFAAA